MITIIFTTQLWYLHKYTPDVCVCYCNTNWYNDKSGLLSEQVSNDVAVGISVIAIASWPRFTVYIRLHLL